MGIRKKLNLYWRRYSLLERIFVLLPLLVLTPRLYPLLPLGHNGEASQELTITFALCLVFSIWWVTDHSRREAARKENNFKSHLILPSTLTMFAAWSGLSVFWTSDRGGTIHHTILWIDYSVLVWIGVSVLRRRSKIGLGASIILTACLLSIFRLVQFWQSPDIRPSYSPLFGNIGVETELLITLLPVIITTQLTIRKSIVSYICLIIAAVTLMASLSTYQRTPIIAFSASAIVLLGGFLVKKINLRNRWRPIILGVTLAIAAIIQISLGDAKFISTQLNGLKTVDASGYDRLVMWRISWEMFLSNPICGIGAGAFKAGYASYRVKINRNINAMWEFAPTTFGNSDGYAANYRAHNEFLQILGELGGIGIILIICIFVVLGRWISLTQHQGVIRTLSVVAGGVAFLISSQLTSFSFRWIPSGFLFFLLSLLSLPEKSIYKNAYQPALISKLRRLRPAIIGVMLLVMILCCYRCTRVFFSQVYQSEAKAVVSHDSQSAIELYQKALSVDPYNFSASFELGYQLYRMKRPQEAIRYFEDGIQYGANGIFGYALIAIAYEQSSNNAMSADTLRRGLDIYPNSTLLGILFVKLLRQENNFVAANEKLKEMLAQNRGYTETLHNLLEFGVGFANSESARRKLPYLIDVGLESEILIERAALYTK